MLVRLSIAACVTFTVNILTVRNARSATDEQAMEIVDIEDSPYLLAGSRRLNYRVKAVFDRHEAGIFERMGNGR